jgi:hypothetical protein
MAAPTKAQLAAQLEAARVRIAELEGLVAARTPRDTTPVQRTQRKPLTPFREQLAAARDLAMRTGTVVRVC